MKFDEPVLPFWMSAILSLLAWSAVVFFSVALFCVGLFVVFPFSMVIDRGTRGLVHRVAVMWARAIMATSPLWRLHIEGRENVVPGKPYVVVSNHQSLMDILVVLAGLPVHFKFLAKRELFPIPFFGWHMWLAGYIPLDRASHESGRKALFRASQWFRRGVSVLFFPEGTRSLDKAIHQFKIGSFKIARDENLEVLPIVIDGTGDAVPKKSWRMKKITHFYLSIGKPVSVSKDRAKSLEEIRDSIRGEMVQRLNRIRTQKQ
jgi:1-acyl-sn-glycerol-3-phosphate acyltransferase